MAWNIPGKNSSGGKSGNGRNPWKPGSGGGLDGLFARLSGLFGAGGGRGRWIAIAAVLWLAFNCFVLITEQQRGVVLRFGQFARIMQPGPNFKFPWPIERVTKVNATQIKTFSETVPVLTRDENIVSVEINVQYRVSDAQRYLFGTR
ncbi:MAG: FtsH protease activity modulator HflK, partial [Gammaproteobacteria bacterium]|nr:FtsH protease activity modulator HflK [Gammaproteobacteria bacterium]